MANIQEEITGQVWNLILKFLGTGSEFVYEIAHEGNVLMKQGYNFGSEILVAMINKQKEKGIPCDVTAKMLERVENGETINNMLVAEEEVLELGSYFKNKGILYNVIESPGDDTKVFMYMSGDAEKAKDVIALWQAEKGLISELKPTLFLENFALDGVGTLSGLDRADLELFRDYAKKNNLVFTSMSTDDPEKYLIAYDPKDSAAVKKTMASVVWAFSGEDGARYKEQTVVYLKNRQKINRSLSEGEKEFYIVNGKSPEQYVFLTANDLTYYKNSKEILNVSRSSSDFLDRSLRVINGMAQPVILSRDEFELFKENGERDKEAVDEVIAGKTINIPEIVALREWQEKQNRRLERIQTKMALDDENTGGFWIYDDSIGYATGAGYEEVEDLDDQTKADVISANENAKKYAFFEVKLNDSRSVDCLIAEAEKRRRETYDDKTVREQER